MAVMNRTTRELILDEIEAFLSRSGMDPTRFGRECVNDPSFVRRLRAGTDIRTRTIDRIREFIGAHERPLARRRRHEARAA